MVDDDIDDQEIFSIALKELDVAVDCVFAFDGEEAIRKLEKDPPFNPDLIFLDFNMPKMNGKECLAAIKKIDRLSNIPVIVFSTSSDKKMERELTNMGAAAYYIKPSSISELTKKLAELIGTL
jgi:CheY-like chemotaxis protein